ncbi:MAG: hypothetical protein IMZ55_16890 [Acidobacteria bacterium]|nr:hypothetical protein [Acidobacteriota bacterium]
MMAFLKAHRINRVFFMMGGVAGFFKDLYGDEGDFSRYNVEKFRASDFRRRPRRVRWRPDEEDAETPARLRRNVGSRRRGDGRRDLGPGTWRPATAKRHKRRQQATGNREPEQQRPLTLDLGL